MRKDTPKMWRRAATLAMPAAFAWVLQSGALAQNAPPAGQLPGCTVSGSVTASRLPLPGVVMSLTTADAQPIDVSSSGPDGTYALRVPAHGKYLLTGELVAFAPVTRDVAIDEANCHPRVDVVMTLASRAPAPAPARAVTPVAPATPAQAAATVAGAAQTPGGGRGQAGRGQAAGQQGARAQGGRGQQFQSLSLVADQAGLARPDDSATSANDALAQALLPPGFSTETSSESVTALGTTQGSESFFGPLGDRFDAMRDALGGGAEGQAIGGQAGGGGRGGPGGGRGGPGGEGGGFAGFAGRGGRGGANQVRGSVFQSFDTSALDAGPYALNGQATTKPQYLQQRFGATIGGPFAIPHVFDAGPRTFFFLNYTGNHSSSPYDQYSTVPTDAERAGDFSADAVTIINPLTHQPFTGNQIPAGQVNPAAQQLLKLIPAANQQGVANNFHTVDTTTQDLDDINIRIIHNFGAQPQRGRGAAGGGGGRGGGRGGSNLNLTIHYRHSDNSISNPFPTLGGSSKSSAWDMPASYSFTKAGIFTTLRFDFNRQHSETTNLYAGVTDVAGLAGLQGVSTDPFDWGAPNLSIGGNISLRDTNPSTRTDRTISFGDSMVKTRGKHTMRFGGDYRSINSDIRTDTNPRGSFVFTGQYSGSAFSDFLLGYPQQSTAQYGPGPEQFHQTSWDLFLQDNWLVNNKFTVNAGLRYEYYSPYTEANNRMVTLDAPPDFTAAVPVMAGQTGPYAGALPDSIVRPFRAGLAPRVAIAWKATPTTTVRTGYGINYSNSTYASIAQQLAAQPPFSTTNQVLSTAAAPIPIQSVLTTVVPGTLNTYAVDPNYRLGYVQIWNLDVQRDFIRTISTGITYVGTHGSNLDLLRAPNRNPNGGLGIAGVQPFVWESSGATSTMNSLSFRIRKRLTHGWGAGMNYTLSKSIDDASSIGGGASVVAQNDLDLAAERGLSSFDQRHRANGDFTIELPFGPNRPWLNNGIGAALLESWVFNGSIQLATGTPFTARVLSNVGNVSQGVNGTLRANYNGQPIAISDPTTLEYFNTAAFSPPASGTFGNAGRNTIIGPGTENMNLSLTRNLAFGGNRGMSIQLTANNVFNTVQFSTIDTVVNSRTFGQVIGVRAMRRVQIVTRFRF